MGKLIVTEFVTLDGVAQAPGGPDEDRDRGFTHGGWQAPLMDQEGDNVFEQAKSMDALLLGRRTYEIFAGYWPTAPEEIPFTSLLNGVPKYVASRTLAAPLDWAGSTLVGDSIAEDVTSLKERHGELHVIGSLNLVQSLLRFGLVDRLQLWLYPVLLGSGKQVFADGTVPTVLRLVDSVTYPNGLLQLRDRKCDHFGIPSTSHWTGAAIIVQSPRTKTYIVTTPRTSTRRMPFSWAG